MVGGAFVVVSPARPTLAWWSGRDTSEENKKGWKEEVGRR
jgi:hypothetical protein